VGEVGLTDFHRPIEPSFGGAPEVGWALVPSAWGRGFGVEAVAVVLAWSDAQLAGVRTGCVIAPENVASLRLAKCVGSREHARTLYRDATLLLLERLARPSGTELGSNG
jgi:RimJ/RimL family protein N-acetyltransferase